MFREQATKGRPLYRAALTLIMVAAGCTELREGSDRRGTDGGGPPPKDASTGDGGVEDGGAVDASVGTTLSGPGRSETFVGTLPEPGGSTTYEVVMNAPGYITAAIFDVDAGECPLSRNTQVELRDGSDALLGAEDDIAALDPCVKLDHLVHRFARVGPGTYRVRLTSAGAVPEYRLMIGTIPATCGDGIVYGASESCDDGNRVDGDRCDASCRVEGDREVEPNDSSALSNHIHLPSIAAALSPGNDRDVFDFSIPMGVSGIELSASVGNPGSCAIDDHIELELLGPDGSSRGVRDDSSGPDGRCGRIAGSTTELDLVSGETYFVRVRARGGSTIPAFNVWRYYTYVDTITERDPNDQPQNAFVLSPLAAAQTIDVYGRIRPASDVDFYEVHVHAERATLVARTYERRDNPQAVCGSSMDTVLTLYSRTGRMIQENDDIAHDVDHCSRIERELERGVYYLRVSSFDEEEELSTYFLKVELR